MLKDCKTPSPESFPQYPCEVGVWWGKPEAQRGYSALLSLHEEPEPSQMKAQESQPNSLSVTHLLLRRLI